ncbi:metal-dependent hydrolase [Chitinivorax sp. B]|uniref:metal-dependent hydrolase n=1 Tax=Chitinivorax sp. B TaxID=2502235 RepID=UPI0010F6C926|nr:metal-dependent hydrolase [Chitinivorax sp. B]
MPTIMTHAAVPLTAGLALGRHLLPPRLILLGIVVAMLPDLDVVAFKLGIPYAHALGHRGITHSLTFAVLVAVLAGLAYKHLQTGFGRVVAFIFICTASHGVLDAFTTGGLGIALFWPWSEERLFAPYRMIRVSPIGLSRFLSDRGLIVLWSELRWVWLPCLLLGLSIRYWRLNRTQRVASPS